MPPTVEPADVGEIAEIMARSSRERQRIEVRGGGTKLDWGRGSQDVDLVLSTRRLNAVLAHRHGDLTATVQAGGVLADVNRELARHGQWIPLDPLWSDRATIGGIVATNDAGPRRQRYGAPRDLIIGVELARADGVLAKAGGIVVKNVAGYDVARLMTGSFGSLGVIVAATFKLYPVPRSSRTLLIDAASHQAAGAIGAAVAGSQLTPTAIELRSPPPRLLIRFESTEASVDIQSREATRLAEARGAVVTIVQGDRETTAWAEHMGLWERAGAIAKLTILPSELVPTLDWLDSIARQGLGGAGGPGGNDAAYEIAGRAAVGVLFVRVDGSVAAQATVVSELRRRFAPGRGSVVLLRAAEALKEAVGIWGPMGDAFPLMQAVKRAFDPHGMLNPGRGPGGL